MSIHLFQPKRKLPLHRSVDFGGPINHAACLPHYQGGHVTQSVLHSLPEWSNIRHKIIGRSQLSKYHERFLVRTSLKQPWFLTFPRLNQQPCFCF